MNVPQQEALRDQFAVAIAQGYEVWRWTRGRDEDGLPAPVANESIARDIWRQANLMMVMRPTAATEEYPPCPDCGWRSLIIGGQHQACLRCDKLFPWPRRR